MLQKFHFSFQFNSNILKSAWYICSNVADPGVRRVRKKVTVMLLYMPDICCLPCLIIIIQ